MIDVQATVSADRKYVTLTMQPTLNNLIGLQTFAFPQFPPLGFVGGANPSGTGSASGTGPGTGTGGGGGGGSSSSSVSPAAMANRYSILNQRGMILVSR